jgi:hypothetical protein
MKSCCGCSVLPLGLVFLVHLLPLLSLDLAKVLLLRLVPGFLLLAKTVAKKAILKKFKGAS